MELLFHVLSDRVSVTLVAPPSGGGDESCDERTVESVDLTDTRSLSQTLLPAVDGLLGRHALRPEQLTDIRVISEVLPGFTSYRVVETTARVLRIV